MESQVRDREFSDLRIGFGIQGMLTEVLYDTGRFHMLEEKRSIREQLGLTQERIWGQGVSDDPDALGRIAEQLGADALAYAVVTSYGVPTSGLSAGIYSRSKSMARLEIRVCLYQRASGRLTCRSGKGSADSAVNGLFLSYRDDGRLSTKSLIGKASKDAIDDAVKKLIPSS